MKPWRRPARLYHPDDGWTDAQYRAFVRWLIGHELDPRIYEVAS